MSDNNYHKFILPDKPPENYKAVLDFRNRQLAEAEKNSPPQKHIPLYSCCGKDCRLCEYYTDPKNTDADIIGCSGCYTGGDCDIRECCMKKGCSDCSYCSEFACDKLKASALDELDAEEDSDNIVYLKAKYDRRIGRTEKAQRLIIGACVGTLLGFMIGAVTLQLPQFVICGAVVGTAVTALTGIESK